MAIYWDDIALLQALDRLEGEHGAHQIDGEQLMQIVAGDEHCTDPDRVSLTGLLYTLGQRGRLSFEIKSDPGLAVPAAGDPRHLQWLWRFKLTQTGRDRPRARTVLERRPDPDADDGRPIPGLALDRFAGVIAAWYTPAQVSRFLHDSGLARIRSVQTHGSTEDLSANLAAYEQGGSEQRVKLRRFLAAFLNGDLDPAPDSEQRDQLIDTLAMAGWHLKDDILVVGERVIPAKPRATAARTVATALEREAIARAGEAERERDLALEQARVSELARQAAEQQIERVRQDAELQIERVRHGAQRAQQQAADATRRAQQAETHLDDAVGRSERAEQHARSERAELERELAEQHEAREQASASAGEAERERDLALEQARVSELARQAAEQQIERVRQDADQQTERVRQDAQQQIERVRQDAERAEREQQERSERAELERDRAQVALEAEQRLRAQLQADLETAQQQLEAAETARDAAIAPEKRPGTRRVTPRRKT
ncbi:MAG: hypothetical protein ACLP8S_14580 [Solirubrobacteraceae bacterium]